MTQDLNERLETYRLLMQMKETELSVLWQEITDKEYWYYLEVVMPARMKFNAFLGGDPIVDNPEGALYIAVCLVQGRAFRRPACVEFFDPAKYTAQIREQFEIGAP